MSYDEALAERVRDQVVESVDDVADITEKKMFGGLAFLIRGHMAVVASGRSGLMVRCVPDDTAHHLQNGAEPTVMRGSQLTGWVDIPESAVADDALLAHWVGVGVEYVHSLPPKVASRR